MSVLTISGTTIPDPTYQYSRVVAVTGSLPYRPVLAATAAAAPASAQPSFTRPERKSYSVTTAAAAAAPPTTALQTYATPSHRHHHSRTISQSSRLSDSIRPAAPSSNSRPTAWPPRPTASHSRQNSGSSTLNMHRQSTTASTMTAPRRSTSSRSTTTSSYPASYVALMRKQKATVWCDRAQSIDPRIAAAQKAAKHRAALEVQGVANSGSARTSTLSSGGVVGKIRHGGVPKAPGYVPANLSGAGVPMRLSANEMLADENEGRSLGDNSMIHARTGSGRSSTNSMQYRSGYPRPDQGRFSSTSTPSSGGEGGSPTREPIPETGETAHASREKHDDDKRSTPSADREDSFGDLKDLSGPSSVQQAMLQVKKADDLRRRGSVDERAMSMSTGVRLFVANPDVEDS